MELSGQQISSIPSTGSSASLRPELHYVATLLLVGIYGIQVCPFIESLSPVELAIPLVVVVLVQYVLRYVLSERLINRVHFKDRVTRSFQYEWGLFLLSGLFLTVINAWFYDFPLGSGLKMVLGFGTIGFFAATDMALEKELQLAEYFKASRITITPDNKFFPLAGKFSLFASTSIITLISVFFLVITKDLDWLNKAGNEITIKNAQLSILKEFAFVGMVLLGYILTVIFSYSRNLKFFLNSENNILAEATSGKLDVKMTVSSNDEFGVMAYHTNEMIASLYQKTLELQKTQDATILSLTSLAETRHKETGAHIMRTQRYVRALAIAVRHRPKYRDVLTDECIDLLYKSAPLHDIGKVGIPDRILLKPGKLDDDEFTIMKTHTTIGAEALDVAVEALGNSSFLTYAREIAISHHEKWDGSGYPMGLKGDAIPVSGRLMAIADVYDALISKRVYKEEFSHEKAMLMLEAGRGTHFDPDLVAALHEIEDEFIAIASKFADRQ